MRPIAPLALEFRVWPGLRSLRRSDAAHPRRPRHDDPPSGEPARVRRSALRPKRERPERRETAEPALSAPDRQRFDDVFASVVALEASVRALSGQPSTDLILAPTFAAAQRVAGARTWEWLEADLPTLIEPLIDVRTYATRFAALAPDLAAHAEGDGAGARAWWELSAELEELRRLAGTARETIGDCVAAIRRLATINRRARIRLGLEVEDLRDDRHAPSVIDYAVVSSAVAAVAGRLSDANLTIATAAPAAIRQRRIVGVSLCPASVAVGDGRLLVSENVEITRGVCSACDAAMDDARHGVEDQAVTVADLPSEGRELSMLATSRGHVEAIDRQVAFASRVLRTLDELWTGEERQLLRWLEGPQALGGPERAAELQRDGIHWACHASDALMLVEAYGRTARHEPGDPDHRFDERDWTGLLH